MFEESVVIYGNIYTTVQSNAKFRQASKYEIYRNMEPTDCDTLI